MGILVIMFILVILYFYFLLFKPQKGSNVLSDDKVLTDFIQNTLKKLYLFLLLYLVLYR